MYNTYIVIHKLTVLLYNLFVSKMLWKFDKPIFCWNYVFFIFTFSSGQISLCSVRHMQALTVLSRTNIRT